MADLQSGALVSNSRHGGQATLQTARVVSSISQAVHVILHLPCPSHQILQTAEVSRQVAVGIQQQHLDAQVEAQQLKERKKTAQHLTLLICSTKASLRGQATLCAGCRASSASSCDTMLTGCSVGSKTWLVQVLVLLVTLFQSVGVIDSVQAYSAMLRA